MNTPSVTDGMVSMPRDDFEELLERAAERGARHALHGVGLDGPDAAHDIRELRSLLDAFNLFSCAPCQGAVFQRVRIPPGNFRSGR
ncbi:MAG: hypothetical protein HT579_04180 [Candidatus Accumulibacter similis]|nr:MAG: hypothetical protein HT579_04180 [Candidatus Accumulibacter similis]